MNDSDLYTEWPPPKIYHSSITSFHAAFKKAADAGHALFGNDKVTEGRGSFVDFVDKVTHVLQPVSLSEGIEMLPSRGPGDTGDTGGWGGWPLGEPQ